MPHAKQLFDLHHLTYLIFIFIIKCCSDGVNLSLEDEKFIKEKILEHHPEKEKKLSAETDHIMVRILVLLIAFYTYRDAL
jgi:hypothetical protein